MHEHIDEFDLINMNGRIYDPVLGRFIQPDRYVQDPDNLQNHNRYSYALNNPLNYVDPNGYWFGYDDLAAAAVGFMIGVTTHVVNGGELDGQAVVAGLKGAALTWIAWNTFGGSVAIGNFVACQIGNAVLDNIAHMNMTIANKDGFSMDVGFSAFSPYGFSPNITGNIGYNARIGDAYVKVGASFGIGSSYDQVSKEAVASSMLAGGVELGYKDVGFGINTAMFDVRGMRKLGGTTSNTSQRIGGVNIRIGDFNLAYQNDWQPKPFNALGDGGDRFRTASIRASYKDFSLGFKLVTGDEGHPEKMYYYDRDTGKDTYSELITYRLGAVYVGYQNYQLGWNSEAIRHNIQNKFAHDYLQKGGAKWFKVQENVKPGIYSNNSTYYYYSLW